MGAVQTRTEAIDNIFKINRLDPKKDKLVLKNLLNYQRFVRRDYNFEFNHIASLYFLDKRKNGYFLRDDLIEFAGLFVQFKTKNEQDYLRKFQAYASTQFWKDLKDGQGQSSVAEWMLKLFKESCGIKILESSKDMFFTSSAIQEIYQVLRVEDYSGVSFEVFIRWFQKVAEDSGQFELLNPEFDDVVPMLVVAEFFRDFLDECYSYLQNILQTTATKI
ncbi:hypothetical protein EIN_250380 [Entamoeba invadens IP1]|uniref:EF-hand domain-containing protein n=1 Tax=Entamoeba invadens IP1 TaxID=370355 RepID=A0A0A1UGI5_ENTIV|nr:hypothetical protein EIN_250380 [Entamoeba invadens IP1]ELP94944.1 hypothetical protein EIN_250380 [Entamoeba invadens IP1]|eukprot:XP_004261715.1 hypothetical protein EIN_250380 [Entamoeba invadens IP1]